MLHISIHLSGTGICSDRQGLTGLRICYDRQVRTDRMFPNLPFRCYREMIMTSVSYTSILRDCVADVDLLKTFLNMQMIV